MEDFKKIDWEHELRILAELESSEGFARFKAAFKSSRESAYYQMMEAADPTKMVEHRAAVKIIDMMLSWPIRQGEIIRQQLDLQQKKAQ